MNVCTSKKTLNKVKEGLNDLLNTKFVSGDEVEVVMNRLTEEEVTVIEHFARKAGIKNNSVLTLSKEEIDMLYEYISSLEIIHITLPFEPTISFEEFLQAKIVNVSKIDTVLDIRVDFSLVAGTMIGFRGKIYDSTLVTSLRDLNFNERF